MNINESCTHTNASKNDHYFFIPLTFSYKLVREREDGEQLILRINSQFFQIFRNDA